MLKETKRETDDRDIKKGDKMNKPFWSIEKEYKEAYAQLEDDCYDAETLLDAVKAGANMTFVFVECDGPAFYDADMVGYLNEDGTLELEEGFTEEQIRHIKVKFDRLDEDGDGYTIAFFQKECI